MRRDPPNAQTAPARDSEGPPQRPANNTPRNPRVKERTAELNDSGEPFTYARLTQRDRDEEARRLEETREARRQQLADLGLHPRDHSDDLTTARAHAAVDRTRGHWTPSDEDWFRQVVERVGSRGVFVAGTDPADLVRGEAA